MVVILNLHACVYILCLPTGVCHEHSLLSSQSLRIKILQNFNRYNQTLTSSERTNRVVLQNDLQ